MSTVVQLAQGLVAATRKITRQARGLFVPATKTVASASRSGGKVRGFWDHVLSAPERVTDPEKLIHIAQPYAKTHTASGVLLPVEQWRAGPLQRSTLRYLADGIIPHKAVMRLIRCMTLKRDRFGLQELERLLFGGGTRWTESYENLVTNEGLAHALDVVLSGGTQDTSWFVFLLAASPSVANAWTATEVGNNDFVDYDEATLPAYMEAGVTGTTTASVTNAASTADFTINQDSSSIGGAGLIGTNTKATPSGTVYAAGAFTSPAGNKAADSGDTLSVTAAFSTTDDGA